ncbi:uncharacterized protein LOC143449040 isoform X2 [Clavelina lepadiformis]|uniref:uncharacterized protein LOC143449040 isoform X2 n=1 Tax=Clavelina lepadiformis TaxID=159417 RepID=UPI004041B437
MFTFKLLVGYTQFMVFVIIRLIITGSIAGRLFADDINKINCSFIEERNDKNFAKLEMNETISSPDANSYVIKKDCLRTLYYDTISPLTAWALTILSAVLPWLLTLPWIPCEWNRKLSKCPKFKRKWPCPSYLQVCFLRASMRLSLELVFFIWVIATYRMYIPPRVTCYKGSVTCETEGSGEKTTFLWILTVVNLGCAGLSAWELAFMSTHKNFYYKNDSTMSRRSTLNDDVTNDKAAYRDDEQTNQFQVTFTSDVKKISESTDENNKTLLVNDVNDDVFV